MDPNIIKIGCTKTTKSMTNLNSFTLKFFRAQVNFRMCYHPHHLCIDKFYGPHLCLRFCLHQMPTSAHHFDISIGCNLISTFLSLHTTLPLTYNQVTTHSSSASFATCYNPLTSCPFNKSSFKIQPLQDGVGDDLLF